MVGGGGERVTLRIVAKQVDHWNVWGGPKVLAHKGAILAKHCEAVGRNPKDIRRSANMVLLFTEDPREIDALAESLSQRLGRSCGGSSRHLLGGYTR